MKAREIQSLLAAADPVDRNRLEEIGVESLEAELLADLDDERQTAPERPARRRRGARPLAAATGATALAAVAVIAFLLAGGGSQDSSRAYGAELVRFAESTPLLLLDGPGWRVQNVTQYNGNGREGIRGSMEFVTGRPIPYESVRISGNAKEGQRQSGMFPPAVRQRRVELSWRQESLEQALTIARSVPHPHGERWVELPVQETTAQVDARAEFFVNQGGPGNRQMTALWSEGGYLLELRAAVPNLAAFRERLDWLVHVGAEDWLDAMPEKVVKAADHDAAVREMLRGIPTPSGFDPATIPNEGLTTNRYQVGAAVTGTVSCLWLRQWGLARRTGDRAMAAEAEAAMATSRHWSILREMDTDGDYPEVVWEIAAAMPRGYWEWAGHRRRLLPHAEGLGCARLGIPVLPRKQRLQRERREQSG